MLLRRHLGTAALNGFILVGLVLTIAPLVFMISASIRPESELFSFPVTLYPKETTGDNYSSLFERTHYATWYVNTFITATFRTLLAVFLSAMAGYAFAKFNFRFKRFFFMLVLITLTLPFHVLVISLFKLMVIFQWLNSYWAIILPSAVSGFSIFLMRQYILSVPDDLIDAARVDGSSEMGIFWRIIVPLVRPGMAVVGILAFAATWNDYLWPLIVLSQKEKYLLTIGIATMDGPYEVEYGAIMAGSLLSTVPIVIVFLSMQSQIIAGLTAGAVRE